MCGVTAVVVRAALSLAMAAAVRGASCTRGSVNCTECSAGFFLDASLPSCACSPCAPGSFSNHSGAVGCEKCPRGTAARGYNSTKCAPCDAGWYADAVGSAECSQCEGGYFSGDVGSTGCMECPAGTSSLDASFECAPCPDGQFAFAGSMYCQMCKGCFSCDFNTGECPHKKNTVAIAVACSVCGAALLASAIAVVVVLVRRRRIARYKSDSDVLKSPRSIAGLLDPSAVPVSPATHGESAPTALDHDPGEQQQQMEPLDVEVNDSRGTTTTTKSV